jgi:hypothetical protein
MLQFEAGLLATVGFAPVYVRVSTRKTSRGAVRYLQLAHNEWDPVARRSRTRVLYSFGREDELDRAGVERLVGSLSRLLDPALLDPALLDPAAAARATAPAAGSGALVFTEARPVGGAHALEGLWRRLGIDTAIGRALADRKDAERVERILFALVCNRALAPSSTLAATGWISHDVHIPGLDQVVDEACYRAMDRLLAIEPALAQEVFHATAHLLNLEVDLLLFDTTSIYFETDEPDAPVDRNATGDRIRDQPTDPALDEAAAEPAGGAGFRSFGSSTDHRGDLPQVVVGMAVTREGIPVRVWCWPGNTADSALIRQVRDDLRAWSLARIVWVADRGFASAENRRYLQRGGGRYILGEKLRSRSAAADAALSRQGRYRRVAHNLQVKEVRLPTELAAHRARR